MAAPRKIAVAGATGRVGRPVVDVLEERGYEVVPMARSLGVDVITREGLAEALVGVDAIVDAATGPSPDEDEATAFFAAAAENLQEAGHLAGVQRLVVVSIVGTDKVTSGYGAAKIAHEDAALAGPIPVRILRATQFHEFVQQLVQWGTQGEVAYVPRMRTQLVAARAVAEAIADLAVAPEWTGSPLSEVAGPREESLVEMATLLASRRGLPLKVEGVSDPTQPVNENGGLLPGPDALLVGPTFEAWLAES